jgi:acetolactate synthase-1/2/3 large subunit
MSSQEITVAVQERLPMVYIVLNDGALGTVGHGQRLSGAEAIGYKLPPVDFGAFGRSLGATSFVVRTLRDLLDLDIKTICRHTGPTLIDARIDSVEIPPIGLRIKSLCEAL